MSQPVFEAWNIVDNLLASRTIGHHLWEPKLLVEELLRRGTNARLLGHTSIKPEDFPGAQALPTFAMHHDAVVSTDSEWGHLENFFVHNQSYQKSLKAAGSAVFENALTLFLNVSEKQLLGGLRWLRGFEEKKRPSVAMILKGQYDWSANNRALPMYRQIWARCPPALTQHVRLCTRSEMSAKKWQLLGLAPHVLPSALAPTDREAAASRKRVGPQSGPMIVSFVAGARRERGAGLVSEVVDLCAHLDIRFLIQFSDATVIAQTADEIRALRGRPNVTFHEGVLPLPDYHDWIAQSVVLLPYSVERYQSRSSGVHLEAKCLGAPMIVPAQSWMAEDVSRLGNGLIFDELNAASIAACIARAHAQLPLLRERAAACADQQREQHGADRCVHAIEKLFAA